MSGGGSLFLCCWLLSPVQPGILVLTPWYEGVKGHHHLWLCSNPPRVCNVLNIIKGTSVHVLVFRLWKMESVDINDKHKAALNYHLILCPLGLQTF